MGKKESLTFYKNLLTKWGSRGQKNRVYPDLNSLSDVNKSRRKRRSALEKFATGKNATSAQIRSRCQGKMEGEGGFIESPERKAASKGGE